MKNQPAFPCYLYDKHAGQMLAQVGMTLRDYFAAAALTGIYANPEISRHAPTDPAGFREASAVAAYKSADCMLKERDK